MSETKINRDLVLHVVSRWRTVALFALVAAIASSLYAFTAAEWYSATLTVVPSQRSQDSAALSLASKLPLGLDGLSTDVQRIHAVLTSNSVADEVIEKFKLADRYGTPYRETSRKALWEHCSCTVDRKSSVVAVTCEDKDPAQAMAMTAFFGEVGNKVFGRVSASSAREERAFLEKQVVKARQDVDDASSKLRDFQEKNKVVDLPEQSKAVISAMASLEGEILSKQLELSYLSRFSSRAESGVVQLQQQIDILRSKVGQLQETGSSAGSQEKKPDFFPDAMRVPALRFQLEQLLREQKIRETVFGLMTQRYEMARVDEARETSTFQILDQPTLPTYKSRPNRRKIIGLGVLGAIALSFAFIRLPLWWQRRRAAL